MAPSLLIVRTLLPRRCVFGRILVLVPRKQALFQVRQYQYRGLGYGEAKYHSGIHRAAKGETRFCVRRYSSTDTVPRTPACARIGQGPITSQKVLVLGRLCKKALRMVLVPKDCIKK